MNFMERLRNFLGYGHQDGNRDQQHYEQRTYVESPENQPNSFDVFMSPWEMQQYVEQQMETIFTSFGFNGGFENGFGSFHMPSIEGFFGNDNTGQLQIEPPQNENLREHFLKKGYEPPAQRRDDLVDRDLDGKLNIGDLDSVLDNKIKAPAFFGQSFSSKTITNPDGSVETHKTVRDSQGNEETTITKRLGDKEYTVIKKRDKTGKEEIIENLINMTEADKSIFLKQPQPYNGFPFDKFFK